MKKILMIMLVATFFGCDEWLDVNKDPNVPTDVPVNLVIPSAQNFIATRLGGGIFNMTGFFAQYWEQAPEANQYNTFSEYSIKNNVFDNDYSTLYSGALEDLENIRQKSIQSGNTADYLVATVLRAYTFMILVDMMDQTPFSEALQGTANTMPKWDAGDAIYTAILSELDGALNLKPGNMISSDLMLNKNLSQWVGFANALKLKLYMRSSYAQDNSAKIKALIQANNFFTGDIQFNAYSNESGKRNPWYETNTIGLGTVNNIACYPIISYLKLTGDPRMAYLFKPTETNEFKGQFPGGKSSFPSAKTKDFSAPLITATMPTYFYTQSELQFFIAEAKLRFENNDAAARDAYQKGVDASFALHNMAASPSVIYGAGKPAEWNSSASLENKLELIMMQKWVSLCMVNHFEAWAEVRRTGYPKLSPQKGQDIANNPTIYTAGQLISPIVNELGFGNLVQRVPFSENASTLNKNTPAQVGVKTAIWWDKR